MNDVWYAIPHHLLAFGLAAILAAEVALTAPGLAGDALRRLQRLDGWYGILAGLLVVVGVLRVIYAGRGAEFYTSNPVFWAKMAAFAGVGLLSIPPTLRILAWSRSARADPTFAAPAADVATLRRWFAAELLLFVLIPVFAAMMARGIGL